MVIVYCNSNSPLVIPTTQSEPTERVEGLIELGTSTTTVFFCDLSQLGIDPESWVGFVSLILGAIDNVVVPELFRTIQVNVSPFR